MSGLSYAGEIQVPVAKNWNNLNSAQCRAFLQHLNDVQEHGGQSAYETQVDFRKIFLTDEFVIYQGLGADESSEEVRQRRKIAEHIGEYIKYFKSRRLVRIEEIKSAQALRQRIVANSGSTLTELTNAKEAVELSEDNLKLYYQSSLVFFLHIQENAKALVLTPRHDVHQGVYERLNTAIQWLVESFSTPEP